VHGHIRLEHLISLWSHPIPQSCYQEDQRSSLQVILPGTAYHFQRRHTCTHNSSLSRTFTLPRLDVNEDDIDGASAMLWVVPAAQIVIHNVKQRLSERTSNSAHVWFRRCQVEISSWGGGPPRVAFVAFELLSLSSRPHYPRVRPACCSEPAGKMPYV